ncbi:MAG TPA: hypothetical protein VFK38_02700 [Candidatus Limnocylindrales bacterium]|nr:hypothetical protein [Candidatus Limnocylindrales bacterium]
MSVVPGRRTPAEMAIRVAIVGLTLATAYIHLTLGSLLFLANAAGYATLAVAMAAPLPLASRFRWLIRPALIGFAAATIGGWLLFGARYDVAYLSKAIEVALIALLTVEMFRFDGGPLGVLRKGLALLGDVRRALARPHAA